MTRFAIFLGGALIPSFAAAHPVHVSAESVGVFHYLTDPFHIGLTVVAILGLLAVRRLTLRRGLVGRRAS